jgi:putative transposase
MDGRGRALDNVFIKRFWRTLKYEKVYLKSYQNLMDCKKNLSEYFNKYNYRRLHQGNGYLTPEKYITG